MVPEGCCRQRPPANVQPLQSESIEGSLWAYWPHLGGFFAPLEWKEVKTFGVGGWLVRRLRIENAVLLVGRKGGKSLKVVTKTKQVNPSFLFLLSWLCSRGWNLWQSLRWSPFLVHWCLLLKNKSRIKIKTVAIFCSLAAVPWRGKGWREKKREEGWSRRRREASKREREKKGKGLEKEEGVSEPETSYLLCFASISMAVTLAPGTSSFPDTQSWCFNGNNELIE